VNGTFEGWLLAAYGWSHHMQGVFRLSLLVNDQISVQSVGDVRLTLGGGQVLVLRNLAIIFDPFLGSISGQFDIFFESGFASAALIQVDTLGALVPGGANVGPEPGMLQISGSGGAKARVSGRFDNNIGGRFTSSLDATGAGQFLQLSELSDVEFYSAFGQ
jgi:hypothetical protein